MAGGLADDPPGSAMFKHDPELHFNNLSPAEAERLALLLEELGEVQQIIGKILRHGYESTHPKGGMTNREKLEKELGDVHARIRLMWNAGDVHQVTILEYSDEKYERRAYLHHQPPEQPK